LTVFQKGAYYSGIKLINHLPLKIKSLSSEIKLFKPVLKRFLNLHSFYAVEEYSEYSFNLESWFVYRDQWKCIYNSSLIILNCIVYKIILPVVLYGCETWSLTLGEERKLRVFENMVLRRISGPRRDEVTGNGGDCITRS